MSARFFVSLPAAKIPGELNKQALAMLAGNLIDVADIRP
jgi:hypothetical protein